MTWYQPALCFFSSCSAWSWSAPLSPTGVPSLWSTVDNATRTWLTLWEPTPWASNCPPRTSSWAPISSSRPRQHHSTTCRGHWEEGDVLAFRPTPPPPLFLPHSASSSSTLCLTTFASCLPPYIVDVGTGSLSSSSSPLPLFSQGGGWSAQVEFTPLLLLCTRLMGYHCLPHMTTDYTRTLSRDLYSKRKIVS